MTLKENNIRPGFDIAVIGMAGQFPGAKDIHQFWENLKNGVASISFYNEEELEKSGTDPRYLKNPDYIKAYGSLADIDFFDSDFFGYTPREADLMDPQQRLFHQGVWRALEHAGYSPGNYDGLIGLYAGASSNFMWEARAQLSGKANEIGQYAAMHFVNRDFLCIRISYTLNLKGPALLVQSTCSTSLVAIHTACQAILNGECDMALAGGVTVSQLEKTGYVYKEGMIHSPDGHCRAFDVRAKGIVEGNGIGIVVLKRLEEAVADGDYIYAVVKGSAINNDGSRKIGFTAPSIEGQADVIMTAHDSAEVEPESIGYIEAHGTGTPLGDPIEIEALKLAFDTDKRNFCAIGSVKTNVGHLDSAAGVAGFIKAVLALHYRSIPPSLHFENPNPKIDFVNSPFYVNAQLIEWKNPTNPLRAGVSSFGIGGTNAHVILEEAPQGTGGLAPLPGALSSKEYQLILLSAKTQTALDKMTENLANHLKENPGIKLADAAYTLQMGRQVFQHRRVLAASTVDETIETLSSPQAGALRTFHLKEVEEDRTVIFMFPGQGAQYINMGRDLYEKEPVFREEMDRCFKILNPLLDYDIKQILYPDENNQKLLRGVQGSGFLEKSPPGLNQTQIAQPLLFIIEYALAKLLIAWGIEPYAMTGHSIGEYVAACLSGVFSPEDALKLVVIRGKLMQRISPGAMSGVPLPPEELLPLLETHKQLSLAAVNSSRLCTVSGPFEAIEIFEKELEEKGHQCRRLYTSHAFHSLMMEPIMKEFAGEVSRIRKQEPELPYISNITGDWIDLNDAVDPWYWAAHIRKTVRFAHGIATLLTQENPVFIEVGPGQNLSTFVRKHEDKKPGHPIVNLIKHPHETIDDEHYLLKQLGELWLYGVKIDWLKLFPGKRKRRLPLPTYPFEARQYPVDNSFLETGANELPGKNRLPGKADMTDWFYVPLWQQSLLSYHDTANAPKQLKWLLFIDENGVGTRLATGLQKIGQEVVIVEANTGFGKADDSRFTIRPNQAGDYDTLFKELKRLHKIPQKLVHLWNVTGENNRGPELDDLDHDMDMGLHSLVWIVQAIGRGGITGAMQLSVVSDHMQEVTGGDLLSPQKATLLGPVKIIPLEYPNLTCRSIDIVLPGTKGQQEERLTDALIGELQSGSLDREVVYRGTHRWIKIYKPYPIPKPEGTGKYLREQGVYLITGGLGGMGFTCARHLAKKVKARLILIGRSAFPRREAWDQWLAAHPGKDSISSQIKKVREMEQLGARVMIFCADVSNRQQMEEVIARVRERFGPVNGILHTAGIADYEGVMQRRTREMTDGVMAPKVKGTLVLEHVCQDMELDFFVLFSSLGNILYKIKFGEVGYNAANQFLDAYAFYNTAVNGRFTISINWTDWFERGMSMEAIKRRLTEKGEKIESIETINSQLKLHGAISPSQGIEVLERMLSGDLVNAAVSQRDLNYSLERMEREIPGEAWKPDLLAQPVKKHTLPVKERPGLSTLYVAPRDRTEQRVADIWKDFLSLDKVGIHDSFFELGASSLDIIQVNKKLEKVFDIEIPVVTMFTYPTINDLKKYLEPDENAGSFSPQEVARLEKISDQQKNKLIQRKRNIKTKGIQDE